MLSQNETIAIIEDLVSFLNVEIEYIQICLTHNNYKLKKYQTKKKLIWTADKINLVELIYALYFANCINNGNVKIKNLIEVFEEMFSVDLGEYYRAYVEIKRRKIIRSKFISFLLNLIEKNIMESDKK